MKTKYILTAIAAAIIFTAQISCTKEAQSPSAASEVTREIKIL